MIGGASFKQQNRMMIDADADADIDVDIDVDVDDVDDDDDDNNDGGGGDDDDDYDDYDDYDPAACLLQPRNKNSPRRTSACRYSPSRWETPQAAVASGEPPRSWFPYVPMVQKPISSMISWPLRGYPG